MNMLAVLMYSQYFVQLHIEHELISVYIGGGGGGGGGGAGGGGGGGGGGVGKGSTGLPPSPPHPPNAASHVFFAYHVEQHNILYLFTSGISGRRLCSHATTERYNTIITLQY